MLLSVLIKLVFIPRIGLLIITDTVVKTNVLAYSTYNIGSVELRSTSYKALVNLNH